MEPAGKNNIEKILEFLPYFKNKEDQFYRVDTETLTLDPYTYSDKVPEFIRCLYDEGFIQSFDWTNWQGEAERYINDGDLIAEADLETLQKLLTTHVRKERFCSGHLAIMIKEGHILMILERLEKILEETKQAYVE